MLNQSAAKRKSKDIGKFHMSTNPQDIPNTTSNPLDETTEKDQAGNPVPEILKEQVGEELKEDNI